MWMATLVQSAGCPLLLIPYLLFPPSSNPNPLPRPPLPKTALIYIGLGLIIAGDNLMYSYGLLYLPLSTYSLVCASQLAFNVIFSYFLNAQKLTALIFNSVMLLTLSATLLGVRSDSDDSIGVSKSKQALGFVLTLTASAVLSLLLSLTQCAFQKVFRRQTFFFVLEVQLCTNLVAACATVVGLFVSGDYRGLNEEMLGFEKGRVSYLMTLVWIAISWQVCSVGAVGLIFMVSSLFSNVIGTLGLPLVPVFAVVFFGDKMDGVKIVAMLIAVWGFLSYIYQHYLDDSRLKKDNRRTGAL
ncbi:probable purine permease 11 [Asparagus officinalis]|uniref:probable purine permease 11 n=1 Tax=Asparagus officinalis TaxID=4686 RepID=UPI00098E291E|nr:probable purine permease 11 [Asparagus officinalis]